MKFINGLRLIASITTFVYAVLSLYIILAFKYDIGKYNYMSEDGLWFLWITGTLALVNSSFVFESYKNNKLNK